MKFVLPYDGILKGASRNNTRADHKHEIRKYFHPQLKRLWGIRSDILNGLVHENPEDDNPVKIFENALNSIEKTRILRSERIANNYSIGSFNFVPLLLEEDNSRCSLDILFLRPEDSGRPLQSGDIDNRIKTLFDALRMAQSNDEISKNYPDVTETPFYCLLEDDALIDAFSIRTDTLLDIPSCYENNENYCKLIIEVTTRMTVPTVSNLHFA